MAIFAQLDENNVVINIITVNNTDIQNLSFPESDAVGIAYLNSFLPPTIWKQGCEDTSFRFRRPNIGYKFHPDCGEHGGFSEPKLAEDFIWDASVCNWIPPVPYPQDGHYYYWNLEHKRWIELT